MKENLTSNQVLELFCAVMLDKGKNYFARKKLSEIIYECKQSDEYNILLSNIKYNLLDAYVYSRDLEKSIMIFKLCGLIYHKGVDSSEIFHISEKIHPKDIINKYLNECSLMNNLVDEYLNNDKINRKIKVTNKN